MQEYKYKQQEKFFALETVQEQEHTTEILKSCILNSALVHLQILFLTHWMFVGWQLQQPFNPLKRLFFEQTMILS